MLNPPSKSSNLDEEELLKELDEIDKQNNNYINQKKTTTFIDNSDLSTPVLNTQNDVQVDQSKRKLVYDSTTSQQTRMRSISDIKRIFQLGDIVDFVHRGIEVNLNLKFHNNALKFNWFSK